MSQHFKLTILTGIFIAGLISANLLGSKVTVIFGIAVSVGIFSYPLTFLITDAVSEVYGKHKTRQIVYAALIAQVLVLLLTILSVKLPAASRYEFNEQYVTVFSGSIRMIIASLIAFIVSQLHDIWAFEFWKKKTKGKFLWVRNNLSTVSSQAIDTLLFMFIAFYHISPKFDVPFILHLSLSFWLFKLVFALIDTPFVYGLVWWLKLPSKHDEADVLPKIT
jgi:queuosine precursor transporter